MLIDFIRSVKVTQCFILQTVLTYRTSYSRCRQRTVPPTVIIICARKQFLATFDQNVSVLEFELQTYHFLLYFRFFERGFRYREFLYT
jgi:hypothetical protein